MELVGSICGFCAEQQMVGVVSFMISTLRLKCQSTYTQTTSVDSICLSCRRCYLPVQEYKGISVGLSTRSFAVCLCSQFSPESGYFPSPTGKVPKSTHSRWFKTSEKAKSRSNIYQIATLPGRGKSRPPNGHRRTACAILFVAGAPTEIAKPIRALYERRP